MEGQARLSYTQQLQDLEHDLLEMASKAESMFASAVEALYTGNADMALQVIRQDDEVDAAEVDIETRCLRLFAMQQPLAHDLRLVSTTMKVITDVERVADLSVDLAKIGLKLEKEFSAPISVDLRKMASVARHMLHQAIDAYVRNDLDLASAIGPREDEVDELYRDLRGQLFEHMKTHTDNVVADGWLLLAIHHIERIADHAVNIAERVHFMVTGEIVHISGHHQPDRI